MSAFTEAASATALALRSIRNRLGSSWVVIAGVGGVVAVLTAIMAMALSFQHAIDNTGKAEIVLGRGADSEIASNLSRTDIAVIAGAAGIAKGSDGKPLISPEVLVSANLLRRSDDSDASVTVRGVGPRYLELRPEVKIVQGRSFATGVRELIAGRNATRQFAGLSLDDLVSIRGEDWKVVGIFESNGDAHESALFADADTLMTAFQMNSFKSATLLLEDKAAYSPLKGWILTNPGLAAYALSEPEYYAKSTRRLTRVLRAVVLLVGGFMALGAFFAALTTMYSAVVSRARQIAIMQSIGFTPLSVVASVLAEALLLGLVGTVLGLAIAYVFFDGNTVSTVGAGGDSQLVVPLEITVNLICVSTFVSLAICFIAGLVPAVKYARTPVASLIRTQ